MCAAERSLDGVLSIRLDAGDQQRRVRLGFQRGEHAVETFDVGLRADPQPDPVDLGRGQARANRRALVGGSQVGPLARRIDRRLQHGDALLLRSPDAAIALRRGFGQGQDVGALKRPERLPVPASSARDAAAATARAGSVRARGPTDRHSSRSRSPMSLLKPDDAIEAFGGRGANRLAKFRSVAWLV